MSDGDWEPNKQESVDPASYQEHADTLNVDAILNTMWATIGTWKQIAASLNREITDTNMSRLFKNMALNHLKQVGVNDVTILSNLIEANKDRATTDLDEVLTTLNTRLNPPQNEN